MKRLAVTIELNEGQKKFIDLLIARGLWGNTPTAVARRLLDLKLHEIFYETNARTDKRSEV